MSPRADVLYATDEEIDDHADGGVIVEHYRLDPTRQLLKALGVGSLIMAVGSLTVAAALLFPRLDRSRPVGPQVVHARDAVLRTGQVTAEGEPVRNGSMWWELGLGLLGLASIATGGAVAIVGLNRTLRDESYLALRSDGAYFRAGRERSLLRWDEVCAVRWDEDRRAVVFERHEGEPWLRVERFAGIAGPDLAKRASEIRRKALFGLLR
jgi:hypothetical protein